MGGLGGLPMYLSRETCQFRPAFLMNSRKKMAGAGSAAGSNSGRGPPAKKQKAKGTFVSKPVPPPTKNVKRTINDLHPDDTHAHGEDGTYIDRRTRPFERFTVLNGLLFPLLAAMRLPPATKDRVDGALYPTADKLRCGKWSSKGEKLVLQCAHCVYIACAAVSQATYPLEEGGEKSVCAKCRDAAGAVKMLERPCTNCGQSTANHPSEPGGKDKRLCTNCAKDAETYAPRNTYKPCKCSPPKRFNTCFICCPSDKLCAEMCHCCRKKIVGQKKYRLGERFCGDCRVMNPEQKKIRIEELVRQLILAFLKFTPTATDNLLLGSGPNRANCAGLMDQKRRPDILFVHPNCFVDMEIDENCHEDRCPMYDVHKVVDTTAAVRNDEALKTRKAPFPGLFIRLNPDAYNRQRVQLKDRVVAVCEKGWRGLRRRRRGCSSWRLGRRKHRPTRGCGRSQWSTRSTILRWTRASPSTRPSLVNSRTAPSLWKRFGECYA